MPDRCKHLRGQGGDVNLMSDEHFTVDGTLLEACASLKSFKKIDGEEKPPTDDPGNPTVNFHGEQRSNQTHALTTDEDAMLAKRPNVVGPTSVSHQPPVLHHLQEQSLRRPVDPAPSETSSTRYTFPASSMFTSTSTRLGSETATGLPPVHSTNMSTRYCGNA
jgi:hypothetical protein